MAKRTIKINLKLPSGMTATEDLVKEATNAAKNVVDAASSSVLEAQKLAKELSRQGVEMTTEEIMQRMRKGKKEGVVSRPAKKGVRKRVVLSDAQKKEVIADLKKGMTVAKTADKYGVSGATVMNIKKAAGLTKKRK